GVAEFDTHFYAHTSTPRGPATDHPTGLRCRARDGLVEAHHLALDAVGIAVGLRLAQECRVGAVRRFDVEPRFAEHLEPGRPVIGVGRVKLRAGRLEVADRL